MAAGHARIERAAAAAARLKDHDRGTRFCNIMIEAGGPIAEPSAGLGHHLDMVRFFTCHVKHNYLPDCLPVGAWPSFHHKQAAYA